MAYKRKRPEDRIGHSSRSREARDVAKYGYTQSGPVSRGRSRRADLPAIPTANERWLPTARSWFNSLKLSGQSEWYEASDWMMAVIAADAFDKFLRTYNASTLALFVRLSERLCVTAVDRARVGIVLDEPEPHDADEEHADAAVLDWTERLGHKHGLKSVD